MRGGDNSKTIIFVAVILLASILFFTANIKITGNVISEVTSCGTLSSNGTYYNLTSDVSSLNTCFKINASNVILDCVGHTINYGSNGTGNGVNVTATTNVTIKNCIIKKAGNNESKNYGIYFSNITQALIVNNTINTNGTDSNFGIYILSGSNNNITLNSISADGTDDLNDGIRISSPQNTNNLYLLSNIISTHGGNNANVGVRLLSGSNNTQIISNTIITTNGTSTRSNYGILLGGSHNNSIIRLNNISTNGEENNYGISISNSYRSLIEYNKISTNGALGGENIGINMGPSNSDRILSNNISTSGAGGGGDNYGIQIISSSNSNVSYNTISAGGTGSDNIGIFLHSTGGNDTISSNIIYTTGNFGDNVGIYLSSVSYSNITSNIISTDGTRENNGFWISGSNNNNFIENNISVIGNASYGVYIQSSNMNKFINTTINSTTGWILIELSSNQSNFTNAIFKTASGSIKIIPQVTIPASSNITVEKLNISSNRAFLNSTNLTFFNTSAEISLSGITFSNPRPTVDTNDDGTFETCNEPQCTELSFSGGTLVFNVTGFSAYSSEETPSSGGGGGGGSGGGGASTTTTPTTQSATEAELSSGYNTNIEAGDKIEFKLDSGSHSLTANNIGANFIDINIESSPIRLILFVGDSKKLNLTQKDYYELYVKLESISANKANITIQSVYEPIPMQESGGEIKENATAGNGENMSLPEESNKNIIFYGLISAIVLSILGVLVVLVILLRRKARGASIKIENRKDIEEIINNGLNALKEENLEDAKKYYELLRAYYEENKESLSERERNELYQKIINFYNLIETSLK